VPITETQWAGLTLPPGQLMLSPAVFDAGDPVGEWLEIEY
jgi:hypothetical protein